MLLVLPSSACLPGGVGPSSLKCAGEPPLWLYGLSPWHLRQNTSSEERDVNTNDAVILCVCQCDGHSYQVYVVNHISVVTLVYQHLERSHSREQDNCNSYSNNLQRSKQI